MATELWNGDGGDNALVTDANWVSDDAPDSSDSATFPAMAQDSTDDVAGSDFSAVLLVNTHIEDGCALNFGTRATYVHLDTDYLFDEGTGKKFLHIDNSTEIRLLSGSASSTGYSYGTSLTGASNTLLVCNPSKSKTVGLAAMEGETFACTTIQLVSGTVTAGTGVTVTTLYVDGATLDNNADVTTLTIGGGTVRQTQNKPTTVNLKGGRLYLSMAAADMPTTVNLYPGGTLDMSGDSVAKTLGTLNDYGGSVYDPANILTITTHVRYRGGTLSVS